MVLAAGRSTRLGPLGMLLPKPLVPICGYPAVAFGLARCRAAGFTDVVINVHHHGALVQEALGDGSRHGVSLRYSVEEELLGTGGGVACARGLFRSEPVLILNAKVVAEVDLAAVVAAHRAAPPGTLATMVVREERRANDFAPLGVDATGRVVSIRGARTELTPVGGISQRMFTGIHVVERALLDRLPDGESDIISAAYIPALLDGGRVHSFTAGGYFAEHSTPDRYLGGNLDLLRKPEHLGVIPGELTGIDPAAEVHPSAEIRHPVRVAAGAVIEAGARVGPEVVVGGGGRVTAGAQIERSVVWDGGRAEGKIAGAVVTSMGPLGAHQG